MTDAWEIWFAKHRDTELADLVFEGIKTLLARGSVTADDLRAVPLRGDPRIRGGAMRALRKLRLISTGAQVLSESEICHHRPITRFDLANPILARTIMDRRNGMVTKPYRIEAGRGGQLEMAI